jgi:hypothetical protein
MVLLGPVPKLITLMISKIGDKLNSLNQELKDLISKTFLRTPFSH